MTEMTACRRRADHARLRAASTRDEHAPRGQRIVDFVHAQRRAKIGMQLGHCGPQGLDEADVGGRGRAAAPRATGRCSPRRRCRTGPAQPGAARDDARRHGRVRDEFVAAARAAADGGLRLLELHMAHGYLLSSFLSPLTNRRDDEYGGTLAERARFPLEVFDACARCGRRSGRCPCGSRPRTGCEGGFDRRRCGRASRALLRTAGCDIVDVSSGPGRRPSSGRPTAACSRRRSPTGSATRSGIPTIAVGAISSYDDVNTIILAGRADLCALARPHLVRPYWTLHAAADQGYDVEWVPQYRSGSRRPTDGRGTGSRRAPVRRLGQRSPTRSARPRAAPQVTA